MRKIATRRQGCYMTTSQGSHSLKKYGGSEIGGHVSTLIMLCAFFVLSAFSFQPLDERKAQDSLPASQHPLWEALHKTKVTANEKTGYFSAQFPPEVKAIVGKEQTVNGFMMPLETKDKFSHFLLSKRTPTCPFCPPGEPNEIIDIWTRKPVTYEDKLITLKGTFELMNNKDMGLFFKLKDATEITK